jgi:hypothetical protein
MTLNETVLQKLADWRPPAGRQTLNLPGGAAGWSVALTADRHDELGSLVWELTLDRTGVAPAGWGLAEWAAAVAERVTGLLEALKVVEVDSVRDEALLRSHEPARRGEKLFYYEVLLRGTRSALVRRYQAIAEGNGRREQVTFALTQEALAKLVGDLTGDE